MSLAKGVLYCCNINRLAKTKDQSQNPRNPGGGEGVFIYLFLFIFIIYWFCLLWFLGHVWVVHLKFFRGFWKFMFSNYKFPRVWAYENICFEEFQVQPIEFENPQFCIFTQRMNWYQCEILSHWFCQRKILKYADVKAGLRSDRILLKIYHELIHNSRSWIKFSMSKNK